MADDPGPGRCGSGCLDQGLAQQRVRGFVAVSGAGAMVADRLVIVTQSYETKRCVTVETLNNN